MFLLKCKQILLNVERAILNYTFNANLICEVSTCYKKNLYGQTHQTLTSKGLAMQDSQWDQSSEHDEADLNNLGSVPLTKNNKQ